MKKQDERIFFQPTIGTESVCPESKGNGIRLVNFATTKNLIVNSAKFSHINLDISILYHTQSDRSYSGR